MGVRLDDLLDDVPLRPIVSTLEQQIADLAARIERLEEAEREVGS